MFTCARCGSFGCEGCLFSPIPGREVCARCAEPGLGEPIPWERRSELGLVRAFVDTLRLSTFSPTRFFRTPTTEPSLLVPIAHGVIAPSLGMVLTYVLMGVALMIGGAAVGTFAETSQDSGAIAAMLGIYGCVFVGMSPFALLFGPMQALVGLVFATVCSHGTLALMGRTQAKFEDTLRVLSYTNGAHIAAGIPVLGLLAWFWVLGVEVIALRELHRCTTDRAAIAALAYRAVMLVVIVGGYAAFLAFVYLVGAPV